MLAVMLLLLAVGSSALVAAMTGGSISIEKTAQEQLNLYTDSIHKTLMYTLQNAAMDEGGDIRAAATLGGQLLGYIYGQAWAVYPHQPGPLPDLSLSPDLSGGADLSGVSITLELVPTTYISPFVPEQPEITDMDESGNVFVVVPYAPRIPQTAALSAQLTLTVRVEQGERRIVSLATYGLTDGFLQDDGVNSDNMLIVRAGSWRLVSYEKVDS